jgi:hypothetical protein
MFDAIPRHHQEKPVLISVEGRPSAVHNTGRCGKITLITHINDFVIQMAAR